MKKTTYLRRLETIAKQVEGISITQDETWYRRFAIFSTNLGLMMPQIPVARPIELFKKTVRNQCWAKVEENFVSVMDYSMQEAVATAVAGWHSQQAGVGILHTGSYRLLGTVMAKMGEPFGERTGGG